LFKSASVYLNKSRKRVQHWKPWFLMTNGISE
jgi:hypothetical protein